MPQLQVKTVGAEKVWSSPDGQRTIYKLALEHEGQQFDAKTYSDAISTVGWEGTVESYEKVGKQGSETFVKQPQKEGGYSGGGRGNYQPKDEKGIQAQMAIKAAVQAAGVKPDDKSVSEYTGLVYDIAVEIFAMIDAVKGSDQTDDPVIEEMKQALGDVEEIDEETPWTKTEDKPSPQLPV